MARLRRDPPGPRHRVLIIDDDEQLLGSMSRLLEREGHVVKATPLPAEGIVIARSWAPHLILLDYYMPEMTGADVVREIRSFDPIVPIVLVTGYASEHSARDMLAQHDIQGYHDKADGPRRLMVHVDIALKHYRAVVQLERRRARLARILEWLPELMKPQPSDELAARSLSRLMQLVGASDGDGAFLVVDEDGGLTQQAGAGSFRSGASDPALELGRRALAEGATAFSDGLIAVPIGDRAFAVTSCDSLTREDTEACELYRQQLTRAFPS